MSGKSDIQPAFRIRVPDKISVGILKQGMVIAVGKEFFVEAENYKAMRNAVNEIRMACSEMMEYIDKNPEDN